MSFKSTACLLFILFSACLFAEETDFASERQKMVQEQLLARDIKDRRILDVMGLVERHRFVPDDMKGRAYEDIPIPMSEDRAIPQPYLVAFTAQALQLKGREKVLQIGAESAYQTAIFAELAKEVYCVEMSESLGIQSEQKLETLGYSNVKMKIGNFDSGWLKYAPYDAIVITVLLNYAPQRVTEQLRPGGKLIMPTKDYGERKFILFTKHQKAKGYEMSAVVFTPLIGEVPDTAPKEVKKVKSGEDKKWITSEKGKFKKKK